MATELNEASLKKVLGGPTDVSGTDASLPEIAFNLYKETTALVIFVSSLSGSPDLSLSRNHAIEAGLAVRLTKYMTAVLALMVDKVREHGDVIFTLNRCIAESAINLRFFSEAAQAADYDEFVKSSLRPERDQQRLIDANIQARGHELPIEARMSRSIARVFRLSGVSDISELDKVPKRKDYRKILEAIGRGDAYPMLQGVPSHMVHGTWVDLVLHHLEESGTGFKPKLDPFRPDARLLLPPCLLVAEAVRGYIQSRFGGHHAVELLLARIDDLLDRIRIVNESHEVQLSKRSSEPLDEA
jgi:hypothetical protein